MKKLFKKLFSWIKKVVNNIDEKAKEKVPVAIAITEALKKFLDSDIGEFSTEALKKLIPGKLDDIAIDFIDDKLGEVIINLKLIESIQNIDSIDEKVKVIIAHLKICNDAEKNTFLQGFANLCYQSLVDKKLTWGETAIIIEAAYQVIEKLKDKEV